jgi:hypothetical protein
MVKLHIHYNLLSFQFKILNLEQPTQKQPLNNVVHYSTFGQGKGKTVALTTTASILTILGRVVDIVSSSSVLARRDAYSQSKYLSELGLSCGCNSSPIAAYVTRDDYSKDIVYGDINNYKWDDLYHKFYGEKTKLSTNKKHLKKMLQMDNCLLMLLNVKLMLF